jgi:predicted RNA-binding Zn ribbon-like protein
LAVIAKPDYANSHYNLAAAYREKGEYQNAVDQMKLVLSLVEKGTADYDVATKELDALEKKLPAKAATQTENLTAPQEAPKPAQPQVTLPSEATPPAANP